MNEPKMEIMPPPSQRDRTVEIALNKNVSNLVIVSEPEIPVHITWGVFQIPQAQSQTPPHKSRFLDWVGPSTCM